MQPNPTADLCQQQSGRQQENHLASVFRLNIESNPSRGSCSHESTLRDPLLGKSLEGRLLPKSAGFKDSGNTVEREEVILTSSNTQQGRSISSQVAAAVSATTSSTKYGAIRHLFVSQNKTAISIRKKANSLIPVDGSISAPCRQNRVLYQGGLTRATERAVVLWFAGWGVFRWGMFRSKYDLGTISNTEIISCFY